MELIREDVQMAIRAALGLDALGIDNVYSMPVYLPVWEA